MAGLSVTKGLLGPWWRGWWFFICAATAWATPSDPEESPLYGTSRAKAFATMNQRDQGMLSADTAPPAGQAGTVILVEGARWYKSAAAGSPAGLSEKSKKPRPGGPGPADLTYEYTCAMPTFNQCASCIPTRCGGGATLCVQTCVDPGATCMVFTCNGADTCAGDTCTPPPTCFVQTCATEPTCQSPTCWGTCVPQDCPNELFNVSVPQPGQFQVSFNSSAQLRYTLQFCTNLSVGGWTEAGTTNGTGSVITLRHTNAAPMALYRLLLQTQ